MRVFVCAAAVVVSAALSSPSSAQTIRLTLADALERARQESPAVIVARARVEEARGRLIGARVRFRDNPQVSVSAGPRRTAGGTTSDVEVGVSHSFEIGGQRAARIAGAEAAIAAETATADEVRREALEAVSAAYLAHEHAQERRALLVESGNAAAEILRIAEQRYAAGDVAALDVNLAKGTASRARAAVAIADAEIASSGGVLVRLLNLDPSATIDVDHAIEQDRGIELAPLLSALETRPDFVALQSLVAEAEAERLLGHASSRPDLGLDVRARKEGDDRIFVAGFSVSLPWFNKGQELTATGAARAARLRAERDAARRAAVAEVTALHREYQRRHAAAAALLDDALPAVADNQQLSQRSYEEGQLSLPDLIVVRREVVDTKLEYLDLLFQAAQTAIARDAAAGVLK